MKKINRWIVILSLFIVSSYADEDKTKAKMKEPVELVFDTKVSCKDVKPYTDFIIEEIKREGREPIKTICSNDDTDGKLTIVDKDTDTPKIVHEPTNIIFSKIVMIDEKRYGTAEDNKAYLVPKGIAYADLDDDGVDEIFITNYTEYGGFSMKILKNNNGKLSLFNNVIKVQGNKVVILPSKTEGFHDILFQDINRKRKQDAIWKYVGNLKYN